MSTFQISRILICFTLAAAAIAAGITLPYQESWIIGAGTVLLGIGIYFFTEGMIEGHERKWGWLGAQMAAEPIRFPPHRRREAPTLWLADGLEPEWDWPVR